MNVLVTGGAGFIGSHLVDGLLARGHKVTVLDNFKHGNKLSAKAIAAIELIEGDVRDAEVVLRASAGCERVFHLAALLGVDVVADNPIETMDTEVLGMRNVGQAAVRHGIEKIVYASTSGVYGKLAIKDAVHERVEVSPRSSYSIAKRYNEIYLAALFQEKGQQSIALRYFNAYGPRQDRRMVIPRFFEQALQNEPLTVFGTGLQTRDFTYIEDMVKVTIEVADKVPGCEIFNVANSREYSIAEVAKLIVAACESQSEIRLVNPPEGRYDFEVERRFGCSDKLRAAIGLAPSTPLEAGLKKIMEYMSQRGVSPARKICGG